MVNLQIHVNCLAFGTPAGVRKETMIGRAEDARRAVDATAWARLDYRPNLIVDKDNPILVMKAWQDHEAEGRTYLGVAHGEDAMTWNGFRSLQGQSRLDIVQSFLGLCEPIQEILFWGCNLKGNGEAQQALNCLNREVDGRLRGTMTEVDLTAITAREVATIEVKGHIQTNRYPWAGQINQRKESVARDGWEKRWARYRETIRWVWPLPSKAKAKESVRRFYQLFRSAIYAYLPPKR